MMAGAVKLATKGNGKSGHERRNVSQLAFRFDLDRGTVRKRLQDAGIEPVSEKAKEKLYELTPELIEVLEQADKLLDEAKLRKETAVARQNEIKVAVLEGELAPVGEFTDMVQRLFGAMHKEIAIRFPKRVAARLQKAKSAADISAIMNRELNKIFTDLREDHSKFLGEK
jgi:hypothetical protein